LKSIFKRDADLDKILKAEKHIRKDPLSTLGKTIKPLDYKFKGLWRYRMGDSRMVYYPDSETRSILIVAFSNRDDIYSRTYIQQVRSKIKYFY
jgi:mRNA-degrading endonuclease RelE of RelBE toxin-antitoxin system